MKRVIIVKPVGCSATELPLEIREHFSLMGKYINVALHGEDVIIWYSQNEPDALFAIKELMKELPTLKRTQIVECLDSESFSEKTLYKKLKEYKHENIILVSNGEIEDILKSMGLDFPALIGRDGLIFTRDQCTPIPVRN